MGEKSLIGVLIVLLVMAVPLPTYFYVSPTCPDLARRVEAGLRRIMENGTYEKIFNDHFGQIYARAGLENRKIFKVANPLLPQGSLKSSK